MGEITWGTATATLVAPLVFLLPGWALLSLLRGAGLKPALQGDATAGPGGDAAAWLVLAAGLTLALAPVVLLALYLLRLKLGPGAVLAGLAVSVAVIAWRQGPACLAWLRRPVPWRKRLAWPDAATVALALVAALVVGVRLWVVRGLNEGFLGDSYQHTLITQLLLDNGGLFDSWAPYERLRSFTYHFGFQANVALFQWATAWLTGLATPRAVVLVGQFLNALAVLAVYPLTVRLSGGRRWAGVFAVLVAGLLAAMPMYYVNWGRYPQLAAEALLPVALWFTMEAVESPRWDLRRLALAALAVAGLGLTHYRIVLFYMAFLPFYLAYRLLLARHTPGRWKTPVLRLAGLGLGCGLLVLPWLWHLSQGWLPANLSAYQQGAGTEELRTVYFAFREYWSFAPGGWVWVALIGALWALVRRSPAFLIALWAGVTLGLAYAPAAGLLDTGLFHGFTLIIGLYLPVAVLVGYAAAELLALVARHWRHAAALAAVLVVAGGVVGVRARAGTLERANQIVTAADEQAMRWIRDNTPPEARFLANAFFAYGEHYVVGSDAGWWIPLLAGRANTVPCLYYSGEMADTPDYREQVSAFTRRVQQGNLDSPEMVAFLRSQGITHVYVGKMGGPLLDPETLRHSSLYELVYDHDGVLIFALN